MQHRASQVNPNVLYEDCVRVVTENLPRQPPYTRVTMEDFEETCNMYKLTGGDTAQRG